MGKGNQAEGEGKGIQVVEVLGMVLVQGFDTFVVHKAYYTGHTCKDCSPLALASGNTCGKQHPLIAKITS